MNMLATLLEQIPFFWEFTLDERRRLAETDSFFVNFETGEYLVREGDEHDTNLLIMVRGTAKVCKGEEACVLATLGQGAVVGEIAFLTRKPRTTSVVANEPVTAFRLDGAALAKMEPVMQLRIKDQLIAVLVRRLEEMNENLRRIMR